MADWWYVIVIVGLAAVAVLYLRSRRAGSGGGRDDRQDGAATPRDYRQEREDVRLAGMSEEDRAWGDASLQRNREREAAQREGGANAGPSTDVPRRDAGDA